MMENFFTGPPWTRPQLHVYAVPPVSVRQQLTDYQHDISNPLRWGVVWQPPEWAHATVQHIFAAPDDVTESTLNDLVARLMDACVDVDDVVLDIGPPVVGHNAVEMWITQTSQWGDLCSRVRDAIEAVVPSALPKPGPERTPHITLGYGVDEPRAGYDPGELQMLLRGIAHTSPLTCVVGALELVWVHRDEQRGLFWWDTVHSLPLGSHDAIPNRVRA